jgi:hypothetical protein
VEALAVLKRFSRLSLGFLSVGVVVLPLAALGLWMSSETRAFLRYSNLVIHESQRKTHLAKQVQTGQRRRRVYRQILVSLVEQRVSLLSAARQSRDLDLECPPVWGKELNTLYPGRTDDERHCQKLIAKAYWYLKDKPTLQEQVLRRLGAELTVLLSSASLELPSKDIRDRTLARNETLSR